MTYVDITGEMNKCRKRSNSQNDCLKHIGLEGDDQNKNNPSFKIRGFLGMKSKDRKDVLQNEN